MSLARVHQLVESSDFAGALSAALAEFRRTPAREIADAVVAIDARCRFEPPKVRKDPFEDAFQEAWLAIAAKDDPVADGWLAQKLCARLVARRDHYGILRDDYAATKYAAFLARLAALDKRGADPRIAAALADVIVRAPFSVWDQRGFDTVYEPVLERLVAMGDARQAEALDVPPVARQANLRNSLGLAMPDVVRRLRAAAVTLDDDERAAWRALSPRSQAVKPREARDEKTLLAAILAHPEDDAARSVYADLLMEGGDPRGELIALQLGETTDAKRKRINSLLRAHKKEWLGELDRVLVGIEFERGFLACAGLAQNAAADEETWERAARDARLATVARLEIGRGNVEHYTRFVTSPAMQGLRHATVYSWAMLDALCHRDAVFPMTTLDLSRPPKATHLRRIVESPSLARVDSLRVRIEDDAIVDRVLDALVEARIAPRIRRITLWRHLGMFRHLSGEERRFAPHERAEIAAHVREGEYVTVVLDESI